MDFGSGPTPGPATSRKPRVRDQTYKPLARCRSCSETPRMKRTKRSSSNVCTARRPYLARMYSSRLRINASVAGNSWAGALVMQKPPRNVRRSSGDRMRPGHVGSSSAAIVGLGDLSGTVVGQGDNVAEDLVDRFRIAFPLRQPERWRVHRAPLSHRSSCSSPVKFISANHLRRLRTRRADEPRNA